MNDDRPLRRVPTSTYRVQLHRGFTFADARAIVAYLARLGIGDLYLSPYLAARPGSTHGYDICDHTRLNPELGGEEGYESLLAELARRDMGHVLDFVPNHMGIDPATNRWWRDVLENGPSSPFARFFDIDWDPVKPGIRNKVLLPILGDAYGLVLERGELSLEYAEGGLRLRYFEHDLPINPRSAPRLLRHDADRLKETLGEDHPSYRELLSIVTELQNLPAYTESSAERMAERRREKEVARERLRRLVESDEEVRGHLERCFRTFNGTPGDSKSFDHLHDLLEAQAYRLAYWRTAFHEINYRRFFDINDLAGLRMEEADVFEATHGLVLRLVREGKITGLRLDHLDGLFDPEAYLHRLRESVGPLYVIAEKILSSGERLPESWPIDGTSGYEFLNDLTGVLVDPAGAKPMRRLYATFTGRTAPFAIVAYVGKKLITQTSLSSELNVLAHALNRISEDDRRSRDFTLEALREALREVVACFPVYRTYVCDGAAREDDRRTIDQAVERARRRNPAMEPSIFGFLREVLLPDAVGLDRQELGRRLRLAMRFQQYTGPVQAKGLEDTAFYRVNVLLALNEVGGDPQRFGRSPHEFHDANRERRERWPYSMLASATHDTKRGEDVRARLAVLSEIPSEWRAAVTAWARLNVRLRRRVEGEWAPDRSEEYLLYQSLVGVWPPAAEDAELRPLVGRLQDYLRKALREAKLRTSWSNVNAPWEQAVIDFVERLLLGPGAARFIRAFLPFQAKVARLGVVNSLSQLVLKIGSPGVSDFYQGTELWDLSLVDPDNRRAVDFELRRRMLDEIEPWLPEREGKEELVRRWLEEWPDGRIKLFVTACGARLRRKHPGIFLEGDYLPIEAEGERREHVVAFARRHEGRVALVAATRLVARLEGADGRMPVGSEAWGDTSLVVPEGLRPLELRSVLTAAPATTDATGRIALAELFRTLPVALLTHVS